MDKIKNKWLVTYHSVASPDESITEEFDKVAIGTGANSFPSFPEIYKTRDQFNGLVIHSAQVRNDEVLFKDKRVLFIGGGHSGVDMATIAVQNGASKVYIVPTRRPETRNVWVLNRMTPTRDGSQQVYGYQCTRQNTIVTSEFRSLFRSWLFPLHKVSSDAPSTFPGDCLGICDMDVLDESLKSGTIELVEVVRELQGQGHHRTRNLSHSCSEAPVYYSNNCALRICVVVVVVVFFNS